MTMDRKFWKLTRWARAGRFWILLILAAAAFFGLGGEARAQDFSMCHEYTGSNGTTLTCANRQEAYEAVIAHAEAIAARAVWEGSEYCGVVLQSSNRYRAFFITQSGRSCSTFPSGMNGSVDRIWPVGEDCPAGELWNEEQKKCSVTCANRPNLTNKYVRGSFGVCHDGCQYLQDGIVTVCIGEGSDMYCGGKSWKPSGQSCQVDDGQPQDWNPDQETCRSTGNGWNECVRPDGTHCVTGAKGTRMCWQPGETGQRNDTANIEWADRVPKGQNPTPPENIENPVQETTTADKGGVSGGAVGGEFVIGGGSGSGNRGGQNNTGSGGSGSGDGDGDGDGEHGSPGAGVSGLYESDGTTIAGVFGAYRARIEGAPIFDAMDGFLSVSVGGACPVFVVEATAFWDTMSFDYHCSGPIADALSMGGYLLLAIAAFVAYRVAFH